MVYGLLHAHEHIMGAQNIVKVHTSTPPHICGPLCPRFFAEGNKVLLFSQWTMTLDLLEWYMQLKGFSYVRLDGNTVVGGGEEGSSA